MATSRYASLRSGIVGPKGAANAANPRSRPGAGPASGGSAAALVKEPSGKRSSASGSAAEAADSVFYGKGAASAKNFRPWYWSYEREAPAAAPAEEPVAVIGAPAAVYEPETPPQPPLPAPAAAKGAPEERAAIADELATTIEHVMSSRYAGAPAAAAASARRAVKAVTAESLMAELSAARQGRPERPRKVAMESSILRNSKPAPSLLDRAFVFAGLALVLGALLFLSPWRDQFLSIDRLTQFLN